MSSKKVISINPDFFSMKPSRSSKQKTQKNKRDKRENVRKKMKQMSLKPNKIKKDLLRRIKEYQKKTEQTEERERKERDNPVVETDDSVTFSSAMKSLEKIISQKKKEKKQKKLQKEERQNRLRNSSVSKTLRNSLYIQQPNTETSSQTQHNTQDQIAGNISKVQQHNINTLTKPQDRQQTSQSHSQSQSQHVNSMNKPLNPLIKPDPPYGCLKGGHKKTYRQYHRTKHNKTLRRDPSQHRTNKQSSLKSSLLTIHNDDPAVVTPSSIHNTKSNMEGGNLSNSISRIPLVIKERKHKLASFKHKYLKKKFIQGKKYKKKYKVHTYRKTYKLGKKGSKVDVLIKNNKTQKKVKRAIKEMEKTPMIDVKKYLKERHLLKTGSNAPSYMLKDMYKNSMLAGDVKNKNAEILVHNYFSDKEL